MSEQVVAEAVIEFSNAVEAACVKLRHDLGASAEQVKWTWTPDKIAWTDKQGEKGAFQISEDKDNSDFQKMLADLQEHKGKLNREGVFYWVFPDGSTVGRKTVKKQ